MTTTPTLDRYRRGDLASLPQHEPDPVPNWAEYTEQHAHDLRSVRLAGRLVACIGYFPIDASHADAFAVVDRRASAGHGRELAALIRQQQIAWMRATGVTSAFAECRPHDRTAQVFLRAIGFKRTNQAGNANACFTFTWSK